MYKAVRGCIGVLVLCVCLFTNLLFVFLKVLLWCVHIIHVLELFVFTFLTGLNGLLLLRVHLET